MTETLGIDLHPDVLPFSNLAAHLPPFLLRRRQGDDPRRLRLRTWQERRPRLSRPGYRVQAPALP